ncbi:MAG: NUDIX domain-containing protein [Candidatus Vogelbacteria bacterium]|nr:NUDIX domain-containing protein [Candidatus Vogelbacteria bacterium]
MIFLARPESLKINFEAAGCFLEHAGEIVLLHRQDHKPQGNTWGTSGGRVEPMETPSDACIREVFEETGIKIGEPTFFQVVYVNYPGKFTFAYPLFHYKLDVRPGIKIKPDEHKAFIWKSPTEAVMMDLIKDEDGCIKLFYGI